MTSTNRQILNKLVALTQSNDWALLPSVRAEFSEEMATKAELAEVTLLRLFEPSAPPADSEYVLQLCREVGSAQPWLVSEGLEMSARLASSSHDAVRAMDELRLLELESDFSFARIAHAVATAFFREGRFEQGEALAKTALERLAPRLSLSARFEESRLHELLGDGLLAEGRRSAAHDAWREAERKLRPINPRMAAAVGRKADRVSDTAVAG